MRNLLKKQLGLTLTELLIAITISSIGFTGGTFLLKLGYKSLDDTTVATQAQQGARISIETMLRELQETSADTVVIDDDAISFASAKDESNNFSIDENGLPDWKKAVVYFLDRDTNTLYRYEEAKEDWDTNFNPSIAFDADEATLSRIGGAVDTITFQLSQHNLLGITMMSITNGEIGQPEELSTIVRLQN